MTTGHASMTMEYAGGYAAGHAGVLGRLAIVDQVSERVRRWHRHSYKQGVLAETAAEVLLRWKGYNILARRFKTPAGEIDLVARRGDRVAFVEVKLRRSLDDGLESLTPRLQGRVRQAAELWMQRFDEYGRLDVAFDAVLLTPQGWPVHMTDVFPFA